MHEHIELGGGANPNYQPNFDIGKHPAITQSCDLTKGIPLEDNQTEHIFSIDFMEHLYFEDFIKLLGECKRVLVDGGMLEFITPDCKRTVKTWNSWNDHIMHMLIGEFCEENPMRHKIWFTPEMVQYILEKEGWTDIEITEFQKDPDHWKEPKMRVIARIQK